MTLPLAVAACSSQTPLDRLRAQLDGFPEYSVVLQDMDSSLFGYTHRYQVLVGQPQPGSDDLDYRETVLESEVDGATYSRYEPFLGMVILSKTRDGGSTRARTRPATSRWATSATASGGTTAAAARSGSSTASTRCSATSSAASGEASAGTTGTATATPATAARPTTGRGGSTYGTNGSATRQSNPDFFRRQQARQAARTRSFGQRVQGRMSGGFRSFGK